MTQEVARCQAAVERAASGAVVALVSSGDPGIYGMAGLAIELAARLAPDLPVEIVPGVSAVNATAACLGAPLMLDFAAISLSDLLVPWASIRQRLEAVAAADLVVALYNPRSRKRVRQLDEAVAIFLAHRPASTPAGIGTAIGCEEEHVQITTLGRLLEFEVGMVSTVVIGNRSSKRLGQWFVTPRGYGV